MYRADHLIVKASRLGLDYLDVTRPRLPTKTPIPAEQRLVQGLQYPRRFPRVTDGSPMFRGNPSWNRNKYRPSKHLRIEQQSANPRNPRSDSLAPQRDSCGTPTRTRDLVEPGTVGKYHGTVFTTKSAQHYSREICSNPGSNMGHLFPQDIQRNRAQTRIVSGSCHNFSGFLETLPPKLTPSPSVTVWNLYKTAVTAGFPPRVSFRVPSCSGAPSIRTDHL